MSNQTHTAPDPEHADFRARFDKLALAGNLRKAVPAPKLGGPWTPSEWAEMLKASPALRREWAARQARKQRNLANVFPTLREQREFLTADGVKRGLMLAEKTLEAMVVSARAEHEAKATAVLLDILTLRKEHKNLEATARGIVAEVEQLAAKAKALLEQDVKLRAHAFDASVFADQTRNERTH